MGSKGRLREGRDLANWVGERGVIVRRRIGEGAIRDAAKERRDGGQFFAPGSTRSST